MERQGAPLGPYRATKLWNEVTTSFRVGMPLRKHRQHLKKYSNCFTAVEAVDWLYDLLRSNSNFGPEVTRQQTIQLLRKFLKNHVIEDIKGRWGSESLDNNNQLFRFPATSPLKTFPQRHPEIKKINTEPFSKDKDSIFKLRNLSRKTPKKRGLHFSQENTEKVNHEGITNEDLETAPDNQEISQEDVEEVWRYVIMIYLQTILSLPSIEELINPNQVIPQYIMYNMTNTSKHGVVILQDKSDDLPHWVLSAMKCLANWPRSNATNNLTYVGFERDVFKTIADYFLDLPEPLLTFEYYELFVNILVVCGYITVSDRTNGIHKIQDDPRSSKLHDLSNLNSFKSTECLLLSLLYKDKSNEELDSTKRLQRNDQGFQEKCAKKMQLVNLRNRRASANDIMGGSCHNLIGLSNTNALSSNIKPRCSSLEGIVDMPVNSCEKKSSIFYQSVLNIEEQNSLLQPHLERVAINALQLCCLLLPPPNRRKLQLLMRMISRMSQNVDMPKLHEEIGTRSLMINTFSRCILCCAEEVDLDELLASRLVSFLMDHHQEILQVPTYLQAAVEEHLDYIKKGHIKNHGDGLVVPLPTYSYCKQISAKEFHEQKILTSQVAIAELLENIIRSKSLPLKEKRRKLKQFQKEYPLIYQKRFPTTESEAALFDDKPTIKQPVLNLRKPKLHSLRY
ncbi:DEP domain-containing protein 1A isoform X2 [Mastomys coucha]|uniref:DEP domain-containing protein 1A isoform X2 n=1 Tax=Mastomys coucha TaxID=35658 RepID=UPI001261D104|nr:DEP domain-containing protein 1A isoform X2 [Mastomys coucha]